MFKFVEFNFFFFIFLDLACVDRYHLRDHDGVERFRWAMAISGYHLFPVHPTLLIPRPHQLESQHGSLKDLLLQSHTEGQEHPRYKNISSLFLSAVDSSVFR